MFLLSSTQHPLKTSPSPTPEKSRLDLLLFVAPLGLDFLLYHTRPYGSRLHESGLLGVASRVGYPMRSARFVPGYGAAQRPYSRLGYVLGGSGVSYNNASVEPGSRVTVDHDL